MSERTRIIERWLDANLDHLREPYVRIRGVHDTRNLYFVGSAIEIRGEGTFAAMIRDLGDGEPMMRMGLPNQLSIFAFRDIYNTAKRKGVQVVCVPNNVLQQADIRRKTMRVIAEERRPRPFRPPQQVIEALVHPRWERRGRTAYFLSGYDLNERGLSYFFCELPTDTAPESVEAAYQLLQPESVKRALAQRRKVYRQGDMFFIRATREEGPSEDDQITEDAYLFRSNHRVSMAARVNGLLLVRGKVTHAPSGRRADHKPLRLPGQGWYIAVQNAVRVTER